MFTYCVKYMYNYVYSKIIFNLLYIKNIKINLIKNIDFVYDIFIKLSKLDRELKEFVNKDYINTDISESDKLCRIIHFEKEIKNVIQLLLLKYKDELTEEKVITLKNILEHKEENFDTGSNLN